MISVFRMGRHCIDYALIMPLINLIDLQWYVSGCIKFPFSLRMYSIVNRFPLHLSFAAATPSLPAHPRRTGESDLTIRTLASPDYEGALAFAERRWVLARFWGEGESGRRETLRAEVGGWLSFAEPELHPSQNTLTRTAPSAAARPHPRPAPRTRTPHHPAARALFVPRSEGGGGRGIQHPGVNIPE
jgi:hypothetical protein